MKHHALVAASRRSYYCLLSTSAGIHVLIDHDLRIPDPLEEALPNEKGQVLQA